ncbi:methyltransferase domain-containing protein [Cyanobium sp. HWJ4-Hawea]|uniref:methyltransferase domain-containing protein n=1 Tax=Cyanobium sp. HWJ4-Hawea TaxID=2823713 RepID=UPI0020CF1A65|nr:methyltransferase domain-containing protein [Cyanobium sp. HWJ4-Hawea]MCP9809518.1 methyltransferase domain-containing protein [Cyanobium sp. HWJ4-Hawea]
MPRISWPQRRYTDASSVASAYDRWTSDQLLERLWGEHIHLGYYKSGHWWGEDFRLAKQAFVHELVQWSGLSQLPAGTRVLDVGCGIGGSARILARDYGFEVLGISISPLQIQRAQELTPASLSCRFAVMDALALALEPASFDAVWSVEACPHMPDKQLYADELLRVLKPGGLVAIADWNRRDPSDGPMDRRERWVMRQLLEQWAHPEFASIAGLKANFEGSKWGGGSGTPGFTVQSDDWSKATLPSWIDSIVEGARRPMAILGLGPKALLQGLRETPTILLMHWAFATGLMQFGVFRGVKPSESP